MEVRVLGPVELFDDASVVRVPRAERTLLVALAARLGERVSVDVLEEALWPDGPPPSARKTLQGHVLKLRRLLGPAAIVELDGSYRLDPDVVQVDSWRVAALVTEARELLRRGDFEAAGRMLQDVRTEFRGEPYEGVAGVAVPAGEVQRLQELRAAVVEDAAEAELARGSGATCIGDLELFVQANPYRERAWGQLMRALYQAGRPADALAAFGRARMILAVDLGIEPGPALREVEQAILTHDPGLVPNAAPRRELGRANLPAAVSPIVGRQLELTVLATMFASERLITLTGVGGIGKTRLAVEIAAHSVGRHEVGPYFVDLAPIVDIELVPAAVAAALGVHADPHEDVMTAVREAIADQQVVLLVDNCEHLLPKISGVVTTVLTSNPGVRILATSREQLGVAGEQVCPVDPLQVPPAGAAPDQIEVSDAGALFLARLPMNLATGPLSPDELAAVGRICRTLAGIPLGLELAAARCRTLSVSQLADRLDRWVGELAPLRHGVTPRHRTMAAALDWGFELLTPTAQVALQAMSVFAGGCDLAAFSTVCLVDSAPPADDVLDELVRTSFVNVDFAPDRTRYRLLEPVRQYAFGHLATSGDSTERHRRHLDYYLDLARALTNDIDQVGFDTKWGDLRPELGNFRAALDWAATDRGSTDAGLRLASRLFDLWNSDGHHDEGLSRIVELLDSGAGSSSARSEAAYAAGFIAANVVGDVAEGVRLWEQALAEARAGADRLGEVRVRRVLSTCEFLRGDVVAARQHLETAIPIATAEGHELLHAYCGVALAQLLSTVGELDEATRQIESVLAAGAGSVVSAEIFARLELARIMFERGDYARAVEATLRSLELAASHPSPQFELEAHLGLVELYCAVGDVAAAAEHLAVAEGFTSSTARGWNSWLLSAHAEIELVRGDGAAALRLAEQVLTLVDQSADPSAEFVALELLGRAQLAVGRADDALDTFRRVVACTFATTSPVRRATGHEGAAAAAAALGRLGEAHENLAAANEIRQHTHSRRVHRPVIDQHLARLDGDTAATEGPMHDVPVVVQE